MHFRAVQRDPVNPSPLRCAFVCGAAWEGAGRVLYVSRAFVIRLDYWGDWLERMPGCRCCWGEQAGSLRLIGAGNYLKELTGEVQGFFLHFGCFNFYCCSLSPKPVCVQIKNPDGGDMVLRGAPHARSLSSGLQLLGCTPKQWP